MMMIVPDLKVEGQDNLPPKLIYQVAEKPLFVTLNQVLNQGMSS